LPISDSTFRPTWNAPAFTHNTVMSPGSNPKQAMEAVYAKGSWDLHRGSASHPATDICLRFATDDCYTPHYCQPFNTIANHSLSSLASLLHVLARSGLQPQPQGHRTHSRALTTYATVGYSWWLDNREEPEGGRGMIYGRAYTTMILRFCFFFLTIMTS